MPCFGIGCKLEHVRHVEPHIDSCILAGAGMKITISLMAVWFVGLMAGLAGLLAQGGRPVHNEAERLAKWKTVEMPFHSQGLSARERQMTEKLVAACRLLNEVYWQQSDIGGLA